MDCKPTFSYLQTLSRNGDVDTLAKLYEQSLTEINLLGTHLVKQWITTGRESKPRSKLDYIYSKCNRLITWGDTPAGYSAKKGVSMWGTVTCDECRNKQERELRPWVDRKKQTRLKT